MTGAVQMAWTQAQTMAPFVNALHEPLLQRHLGAALGAGLMMALIGTLELVLNSQAMDQACHTRTDPRREVLALGAANLTSGLVGGLPLLLLRPRALHMLQVGGRAPAPLDFRSSQGGARRPDAGCRFSLHAGPLKAACNHCTCSPSMATTSKRQGGSTARRCK